jgi:hypothetical protein
LPGKRRYYADNERRKIEGRGTQVLRGQLDSIRDCGDCERDCIDYTSRLYSN